MVTNTLPKTKRIYLNHYNKIQDYLLIKESAKEGWDFSFMCRHLGISRAAYYKWLNSKLTEKQLEDKKILAKIEEIAASNNSLFGANSVNDFFTSFGESNHLMHLIHLIHPLFYMMVL